MPLFEPINSLRITDLIVEQIRTAILMGELKAGDRLPAERDLVTRFKASRIAVREALKGLEAAGFLNIKAGSGAFVARIGSSKMSESLYSIVRTENISLQQITEARLIFEPQVARLAAERMTEEGIARLEANIRETAAALELTGATTPENIAFHLLLADATGNSMIALSLRAMLDVARELTLLARRSKDDSQKISTYALSVHKKIVRALRKKDPQLVYELMYDHIRRMQKNLKAALPKGE